MYDKAWPGFSWQETPCMTWSLPSPTVLVHFHKHSECLGCHSPLIHSTNKEQSKQEFTEWVDIVL